MPIPSQYSDIVSRILKATKEGRVRWNESATNPDFFVIFKNFTLVLWQGVEPSNEEFVSVGIRNKKGELADSFSVDEHEGDYRIVVELYALARRNARRIDEAVAEIAKELESEEQIGGDIDTEADRDGLPF